MVRNPTRPGERQLEPCEIPIKSVASTPPILKSASTLKVECSQLASLVKFDSYDQEVSVLSLLDLSLVGRYDIQISPPPSTALIPASLPVKNIFNKNPAFDAKSRLVRQNACATKQACNIYLNFNYAAGAGAVPGWVLDGKITYPQMPWHRFFIAPLLAANVGNNSVKGQTYTNTIDFGATAQRVYLPRPALEAMVLTVGPTYETDKQFDRNNLLATEDMQFYFPKLYDTQEQKTLRIFGEQIAKMPSLQLSDIAVPKTGYDLDFHFGMEAGGALTDTTVKASKGNATETLPQYPIFRIVPQVHLLLQLGRFSFDELFTGRYLAATEDTVVETATHSLYLKQIQGWKALSTFTGGFAMDPQGYFNFTVTYKDGFAPPNYQRVNAVQAGITFKY